MLAAGVILTDYSTPLVEILKDNSRPIAAKFYSTLDLPVAGLIWELRANDKPAV
jgi:hypothetical protein